MSYKATVFQVMIASPNDVEQERRIAREVIYDWNSLNAATTKIILQPIGWETHSSPEMGNKPQSIINKQVLKNADLLIGIFWTRLGTPTEKADSGTVEEIQEHISVGKPTMLYFSNQPVAPKSIDQKQYDKLIEFKTSCKNKGLIYEYATLSEFKESFSRHITMTIQKNEYFKKNFSTEATPLPTLANRMKQVAAPTKQGITFRLDREANELLLEATKSSDGRILKLRTMEGLVIETNKRNFIENRNARLEAIWEDALMHLIAYALIVERGHQGEVFTVTRLGYEYADTLKKDADIPRNESDDYNPLDINNL